MNKLLLSVLLILSAHVIVAQAKDKMTIHQVVKGETLYSISRQYHVTVDAIEKANKAIGGDMKIKPGQNINIPGGAAATTDTKTATPEVKKTEAAKPATPTAAKPVIPSAGPDNASVHTIAKGESLYSLAKTYGVSVKQLKEANGMGEDPKIKIGQKINIPSKNPEAMYSKPAAESKPEVKKEDKPASKPAREPGKEYLANDNVADVIREAEPVKPNPSPVKVSDEKPATPPVTDKPKEMVKEEKAPEPAEPKSPPAEPIKNTNVSPSDYVSVFNGYAASSKKKVVYRGIGSFLKTDNPGNQFLALYNYAEMGAILKITNLMSKQSIYVKVIGKVPAADAQNEIILKVSSEAASQLKVSEDKFLVEVTGYNP